MHPASINSCSQILWTVPTELRSSWKDTSKVKAKGRAEEAAAAAHLKEGRAEDHGEVVAVVDRILRGTKGCKVWKGCKG